MNNPFENENNRLENEAENTASEQKTVASEESEPQRAGIETNEGSFAGGQNSASYQQNGASYQQNGTRYGYGNQNNEGNNAGGNYGSYYTQNQSNDQNTSYGQYGGSYGRNSGSYSQSGSYAYGSRPYGQNTYGQNPYGQNPYGQNTYGQNPYGQNYSPYYSPNTQRPSSPYVAVKKEKKPTSKSFVIVMCSFFLVVSLLINAALIAGSYNGSSSADGTNGSQTNGNVVIQYAPKDEEKPVVTDKGNTAYVTSLVLDTVVEVTTETVVTDSYLGQYVTQGAGSGVIVSSNDGGSYIITCAHVIEGSAKVTVKLLDGTVYTADSFLCDAQSDIGVIKLNVKGLPCATVGDFSKTVVGEEVVAIGNPLGTLGGSVTNGVISALERDVIIDGTTYNLLQTNAEINPGNSGGGLFNSEGHLIGIVNAKSVGEDVEGLGFAIPIDSAIDIMTDLIEKGYVAGRVKLGFELFEIQSQEDVNYWWKYSRYFTDYGVYIVSSESPDFQEGDLIISIADSNDNWKISSLTDLKSILQNFEVGQTVSITVSRIVGKKVQMFTYDLTLTEKKG